MRALSLTSNTYVRSAAIIAIATLMVANPAFAQVAKLTTVMDNVRAALVGIGLVVLTIAIIWAGYKMIFQHAKWSEIANIVIGGIFVGGAAEFAGWIIG
jgi:type IV secretion system protein VirB2